MWSSVLIQEERTENLPGEAVYVSQPRLTGLLCSRDEGEAVSSKSLRTDRNLIGLQWRSYDVDAVLHHALLGLW